MEAGVAEGALGEAWAGSAGSAAVAADGVDATQATVSRDLEELGAVKVRLPGGETAYALPELRRCHQGKLPPLRLHQVRIFDEQEVIK